MATGHRKYLNKGKKGGMKAALKYLKREEDDEFAREMEGLELGPEGAIRYLQPASKGKKGGAKESPTDILFDKVDGAAAEVFGVTSLNRAQMKMAWDGKWTGFNECKTGYRTSKTDPNVRETGVRNAAVDVFFSEAKSLTLFMIACPDAALRQRLVQRKAQAVHAAMSSLQDRALVARITAKVDNDDGPKLVKHGPRAGQPSKTQGSPCTQRVPAKLMWVTEQQWGSRPTEASLERALEAAKQGEESPEIDAGWHTHALLFTMGLVADQSQPSGYKATTIDTLGISRQAGERDNIYLAELARGLEEEGVELEYTMGRNGKTNWEIKGYSKEACDYFSTNAAQAKRLGKALEKELGRPPKAHELRDAMYEIRLEKTAAAKKLDSSLNRGIYLRALARAGLSPGDFDFSGVPVTRAPQAELEANLIERLEGPMGLCMTSSLVSERDVFTAIARCNVGINFTYDEMKEFHEKYLQELEMIPLPDGSRRYTTHTQLMNELWLEGMIDQQRGEQAIAPSPEVVNAVIAACDRPMDNNQRDAVRVLARADGISLLVGPAGTGKTTTLKTLVDAYRTTSADTGEAYADRIVVLSVAGKTAYNTGARVQADYHSSVEKFAKALSDGSFQPLTKRDVIIVDEAAMMDTARIAKLMDLVRRAETKPKLVFVADQEQLTAIGPSGWWQRLERSMDSVASLETVYRHSDQRDTAAFNALRAGEVDEALDDLLERDRIHVAEDREARVELLMRDFGQFREEGLAVEDLRILVDSSNAEIDVLNRFVQHDRVARGELATEGYEVHSQKQGRTWTLHEKDRIIFLRRYFDIDQEMVHNGEEGEITSLDLTSGKASVRLDSGRDVVVSLRAEEETQPLGLGYALHASKAQGSQFKVVLYAPGGENVTSKNSAYSSLTREEEAVHVYLDKRTHGEDPLEFVRETWSKSAVETPLLDEIEMHDPRRYEELTGKAPRLPEAVKNPRRGRDDQRKADYTRAITAIKGAEFAASIVEHPAFGVIEAHLKAIERLGKDPTATLVQAIAARGFADADSPVAVLAARIKGRRTALEQQIRAASPPQERDTSGDNSTEERIEQSPVTSPTIDPVIARAQQSIDSAAPGLGEGIA